MLSVGTTCIGHKVNESAAGTTIEEILEALSMQFCGCTRVYGNININMVGIETNKTLNETNFSMLYHLEEISGALMLYNIPETTRLTLPNLRIIRGQEVVMDTAMLIFNVRVEKFILPNLTEITQGNVIIQGNTPCNLAQVNWVDIMDNGMLLASFEDCMQGKD